MESTTVAVDGRLLRRTRKLAGLAMSDLATAVGVHPSHISHIERGTRKPSPGLFRRICDTLDMNPTELALPEQRRELVPA